MLDASLRILGDLAPSCIDPLLVADFSVVAGNTMLVQVQEPVARRVLEPYIFHRILFCSELLCLCIGCVFAQSSPFHCTTYRSSRRGIHSLPYPSQPISQRWILLLFQILFRQFDPIDCSESLFAGQDDTELCQGYNDHCRHSSQAFHEDKYVCNNKDCFQTYRLSSASQEMLCQADIVFSYATNLRLLLVKEDTIHISTIPSGLQFFLIDV